MNFSEFKKRLGAEPRGSDPEMLEARRSSPEFEQAAAEAEAFERKLEDALKVGVDEEALLVSLAEIPVRPDSSRPAWKSPHWMALAASVVVVVGIASIVLHQARQPTTVAEYVESHFNHDGYRFLVLLTARIDLLERHNGPLRLLLDGILPPFLGSLLLLGGGFLLARSSCHKASPVAARAITTIGLVTFSKLGL